MRKDLKKKLRTLAIQGHHKKAIQILRPIPVKSKDNDISLSLAFMLYHQAFKSLKANDSPRTQKHIIADIEEAVTICKKIISKKTLGARAIQQKTNARAYLGQIYAVTGKHEDAVCIARENFETNPSAFTANRLADIYTRLNMFKDADKWYGRYAKLAQKEGMPSHLISLDLAVFYLKSGDTSLGKKHALTAIKSAPRGVEMDSVKSILQPYLNKK